MDSARVLLSLALLTYHGVRAGNVPISFPHVLISSGQRQNSDGSKETWVMCTGKVGTPTYKYALTPRFPILDMS